MAPSNDALPGDEDVGACNREANVDTRILDERCLRHLIARLPLAQALWRRDTGNELIKSFTILYGESVARALVKNVTEQLLVAVLDQICAEFEAYTNEDITCFNVANCICALQCLEHIEFGDDDTKLVLIHVLFHCALDRLLSSNNTEEGVNEAMKILAMLENVNESERVSSDRAKAVLNIKKCAKVGTKTGTKAMVLKAAKVRSEMFSTEEVIENLKQCSQSIVERLGDLWDSRKSNNRGAACNDDSARFTMSLPSESMTDNGEVLTAKVPAKSRLEPTATLNSTHRIQETPGQYNDAVVSLVPPLVEVENGLQIVEEVESKTPGKIAQTPAAADKKRKTSHDKSGEQHGPPSTKRARHLRDHNKGGFSKDEDRLLIDGLKAHGWGEWMLLSSRFLSAAPYLRTALQVKDRARYLESKGVIRREQYPVIQRVIRSGPTGGTPRKQKAKIDRENSLESEKIGSFSSPDDASKQTTVLPPPSPTVKNMALDTKKIVIQPLPKRSTESGEEKTGTKKRTYSPSRVSNENGQQSEIFDSVANIMT